MTFLRLLSLIRGDTVKAVALIPCLKAYSESMPGNNNNAMFS